MFFYCVVQACGATCQQAICSMALVDLNAQKKGPASMMPAQLLPWGRTILQVTMLLGLLLGSDGEASQGVFKLTNFAYMQVFFEEP